MRLTHTNRASGSPKCRNWRETYPGRRDAFARRGFPFPQMPGSAILPRMRGLRAAPAAPAVGAAVAVGMVAVGIDMIVQGYNTYDAILLNGHVFKLQPGDD